jgi:hypothetical protein
MEDFKSSIRYFITDTNFYFVDSSATVKLVIAEMLVITNLLLL